MKFNLHLKLPTYIL